MSTTVYGLRTSVPGELTHDRIIDVHDYYVSTLHGTPELCARVTIDCAGLALRIALPVDHIAAEAVSA